MPMRTSLMNAAVLRSWDVGGAAGPPVTVLASRVASQVSLDDPRAVAVVLGVLREAGADDAVHTLLDRDPAAHVSLDDLGLVTELLEMPREVRATTMASTTRSATAMATVTRKRENHEAA